MEKYIRRALKEIIDRAIDKAVCKDRGDGTERLFISIADLRAIANEYLHEEWNGSVEIK